NGEAPPIVADGETVTARGESVPPSEEVLKRTCPDLPLLLVDDLHTLGPVVLVRDPGDATAVPRDLESRGGGAGRGQAPQDSLIEVGYAEVDGALKVFPPGPIDHAAAITGNRAIPVIEFMLVRDLHHQLSGHGGQISEVKRGEPLAHAMQQDMAPVARQPVGAGPVGQSDRSPVLAEGKGGGGSWIQRLGPDLDGFSLDLERYDFPGVQRPGLLPGLGRVDLQGRALLPDQAHA